LRNPTLEIGPVRVHEQKAVGSCAREPDPCGPGMAQHLADILEIEQGLTAGDSQGNDTAGGGMIDNAFYLIDAEFRAVERFGHTHIALRARGIALVGILDNKLAGRSLFHEPGQFADTR
jgi:hypothetical protein